MPITNTDAVLWYNVGVFGEAGYAVPNWSNDIGTLNPSIFNWVDLVGRNLFHIMHHEDVDLRIPPSINTCKRIHKLYLRAGQLLEGNSLAPFEDNMESQHARPAGDVFRVYPIPYHKVRNTFLKRWAGLIMMSLTDAMQHTENRKEMEISTAFAGQVGQYIDRVYKNMAIELFGKSKEQTQVDRFVLTDEELGSYDPSVFFTSTEMVDTVPRLDRVFTEDRLEQLAEGIPVTEMPSGMGPWPTNLTNFYEAIRTDATTGPSGSTAGPSVAAGDGPSIPPPPGP